MKIVLVAGILLSGILTGNNVQDGKITRGLKFTKKHLFVNPYESCAVGDLNRDGHTDIVYGPYWFAGPDFVPRTFRPNQRRQTLAGPGGEPA
ncbi:MAG: hypothetical protein L0220_14255, partial [Acidobacteria bacterium]|nr:hypothetical protein [Acidobacteriota bacterium]